MDSFEIGRRDAYALAVHANLPERRIGRAVGGLPMAQAEKDAATQLLKAAVRLAAVLNGALGS